MSSASSSSSSSSSASSGGGSGGFDTSLFVNQPVDPNLICTICHNVLQKPTSVCSNGHVSCSDCISTWKAQQQQPRAATRNNNNNSNNNNTLPAVKCPDCRLPLLSQQCLVRPLQSIILSLQVKCPNRAPPPGAEAAAKDEDEEVDSEGEEEDDDEETAPPQRKKLRSSSRLQKKSSKQKPKKQQRKKQTFAARTTTAAAAVAAAQPQCCQWQGTLSEYLDRHCRRDCLYLQATCALCEANMPATQLEHHTKHHCPRRLLPCSLCGVEMEAEDHAEHKKEACPEKTISCRHCNKKLKRKLMGCQWTDRDSQRRIYSGHLQVCPKLAVPCEHFHEHGCLAMVKREDVQAHNEAFVQEHARLVSSVLTQVVDDKIWKEKTLVWTIPHQQLNRIRIGGLESQRVKVGDFMAFLVLDVATNNPNDDDTDDSDDDDDDDEGVRGEYVRVKICVEEPLYTPFIRRITFRKEANHVAAVSAVANNNDANRRGIPSMFQLQMPPHSKEMVQDSSFAKDTCAIKSDLRFNYGSHIFRKAKVSDMLEQTNQNITFRATFSLKCPEIISVACAN